MRRSWLALLLVALTLPLAASSQARPRRPKPQPEAPKPEAPAAEPAPPETPQPEKPWAAGVSADAQAEALRIFREGNGFFEESQYPQALERYREAIKRWRHPSISFNIAVCLINLEEPVEAYEHIQDALKFGEAPLGEQIYPQALTYQKLLLGRLAELEISCDEKGAEVSLDGRPLFTGPGKATRVVLPGSHQVVATKPGFLTLSRQLVVIPGKKTEEKLKLVTLKAATRFERRWPKWKPWAVVGAGAGVALLGAPLWFLSRSDYSTYDDQALRQCPQGCPEDELNGSLLTRAKFENVAAISAFAVGGATVVTGIALVIFNQPRAIEPRSTTTVAPERKVSVLPSFGPGAAGAVVTWEF